MKEITAAAQAKGCVVGWDFAHAAGNVPLGLHDSNVDFAVWCSYKYLNSGPGGIGALSLHERHAFKKFEGITRLAGWWALDVNSRFKMEDTYIPRPGAKGYIQSTSDILSLSSFLGSLQLFSKTDMATLRRKSILLTGYLEWHLKSEIPADTLTIITPSEVNERGCQLSLCFQNFDVLDRVFNSLLNHGILGVKRNPNSIRLAPTPLYCSFDDELQFVVILKKVLKCEIKG